MKVELSMKNKKSRSFETEKYSEIQKRIIEYCEWCNTKECNIKIESKAVIKTVVEEKGLGCLFG